MVMQSSLSSKTGQERLGLVRRGFRTNVDVNLLKLNADSHLFCSVMIGRNEMIAESYGHTYDSEAKVFSAYYKFVCRLGTFNFSTFLLFRYFHICTI